MDRTVTAKLEGAGIDVTSEEGELAVGVDIDEEGRVRPVGDEVAVMAGDKTVRVTLAKISALYAGTKVPPRFKKGPTNAYVPFFFLIEGTVVGVCRARGRDEYDAEIERLYTHLRRRPDGHDANPLFSYMQAAMRLYMSLFDVSQAECDAVCRRLSLSAGHFGTGPTSTNYVEVIEASF